MSDQNASHGSGTNGHGRMVVVVGPSGAGKDTLMALAASHFRGRDNILFARRVITRDSAAGGEDHEGVSVETFQARKDAGQFAVSWDAHGLSYGIPIETLRAINAGTTVIANGSRSALERFREVYPDLLVLNIVARPDVLAERLAARGRESQDDILRRLQRGSLAVDGDYKVVTIDNSGTIADAEEAIIRSLEDHLAQES